MWLSDEASMPLLSYSRQVYDKPKRGVMAVRHQNVVGTKIASDYRDRLLPLVANQSPDLLQNYTTELRNKG